MKFNSNEFIPLGAPSFGQEDIKEVIDSLESGWVGTGPKVSQFEKSFGKYVGGESSLATNSCTAALHLSLMSLGLKPGDEVITTPMTFCATINTIIHSGATPVLADCNIDDFCIDPERISEKITKKTKAILPVHFAGMSCDMEKIMQLADDHCLFVIEDCAHAIETTFNDKHAGTFGDFGCFSFYATKNLVTGEGGMLIARDDSKLQQIKKIALHGMSLDAWDRFSEKGFKHYDIVAPGFKYNMTDIQAALGIHQLARIEENWLKREKIWNTYTESFANLPIDLPSHVSGGNIKHAHHLYTVLLRNDSPVSRDEFIVKMQENKIGTGVHYRSIPSFTYYHDTYGWKPQDFPNSTSIGDRTVSIPLAPGLSEKNIERIIENVNSILNN
jgi:dTDP-4-amino-4,6-dideoxygalactose transaminase